jgi:preprotein translocase SecF subunit
MRLFWNSNYDFIKLGRPAMALSAVVIALTIVFLALRGGPNLGIDFTGGIKVDVMTARKITLADLETIRGRLDVEIHSVGAAEREVLVQSKGLGQAQAIADKIVAARADGPFDSVEEIAAIEGVNLTEKELSSVFTTVEVKEAGAGGVTQLIDINDATPENIRERIQQIVVNKKVDELTAVLKEVFGYPEDTAGKTDLNVLDTHDALYDGFLMYMDEDDADALAQASVDIRNLAGGAAESRLLGSFDELLKEADVSKKSEKALKDHFYVSTFVVRGTENIGPRVSHDLARLAMQAMLVAAIGMLIYIWVRFNFRSGVVAVIAVIHDLIVTMGLITLAGVEIDLTVIAALLTIAGYSINDTIVTYDRIREDEHQARREAYPELLNRAINENLARTLVTGMSSLIALTVLFFLGGEALRDFSLTLIVGIIIGTYSSVYVAAALLKEWNAIAAARKKTVLAEKLERKGKKKPRKRK